MAVPIQLSQKNPVKIKVNGADKTIFTQTRVTEGKDANGKATFSTEVLRYDAANDRTPVVVATSNSETKGKLVPTSSATPEVKAQLGTNGTISQAYKTQVKDTEKKFFPNGSNSESKKALSEAGGAGNQASGNGKGGEQQGGADIVAALKDVKARTDYERSLVYPIGLQLEYQDCIKFSVLKYSESG